MRAEPVPPQRRSGGRRAKRGPSAGALFGAAGVLAVVVAMIVGALVIVDRSGGTAKPSASADGSPAESSGPSPVSYSSSASAKAYARIAQRSADAAPLTSAELFPSSASSVTVDKLKLSRTDKRLDRDCSAAAWGDAVATRLRADGCTQAARTTYVDGKKQYALAVVVFNLAGSAKSNDFVDVLGNGRGGGFVAPLDPPDGFGDGFSMARGLAMGHYAVVSWAQRLDGKGDEQDETLLSLIIEGGKAPAVLGRAARS
ncbi:hypothetical protein J4573_21890 [Actinomadura barringtoniae]|uniref:Uncharacterized protein n=1 Tax=Actinomadura barringtoniae TaxID=1427535 RepID=A0A939T4S6_9ACTN|nr:hypothetical protein [Actinomadura barringtoniae]MBO2449768.1 hypothetical protein [Actinomadura barringtoniae]